MIWVPIVLGLFKAGVLGTTIFFAIKSHHDEEKINKLEREANSQQVPSAEYTADAAE